MDMQPDGATVLHSNPATQAGFTIIPNVVLTARRLSPGSRLLYGLLKMYAWQSGNAYPGQQRLADEMGVSTRQIRNYQKELEAVGLLRIEQRGLTQTNRYWIEDIPADFLSDRKNPSDQEVSNTSGQERKLVSDKEDTVEKDSERKREAPAPVSAQRDMPPPERPVYSVPKGTPVNKRPDAPRKLPEVPLPSTYPLTEAMRAWAAMEVPALRDLDTEHGQFCRYWHSRANERRADWRPMWEKWMVDAVTKYRPRQDAPTPARAAPRPVDPVVLQIEEAQRAKAARRAGQGVSA